MELEQIDDISITAEYGPPRTAVKLGLVCTLYVPRPYDERVRQRLAECGDEYQAMFGRHLRLYLRPDGEGSYKPYPPGGISLTDYVMQHDIDKKSFAPDFVGGAAYNDASSWSLSILAGGTEDSPGNAKPAYFAATLPFSFFHEAKDVAPFQRLVHRWCTLLRPQSGYAGIGAIQSVDMMEKKRTSSQVYPLAKRFPGLDVDNPSVIANHMGDRIKGANWLTALDDSCAQRVGGKDWLLSKLSSGYRIFEYEGGLLIQAGPTPQLGDANRGQLPYYYCELSRLLKPIRMTFPAGHSLFQPGKGVDSTAASNEWLARLDQDVPQP
jgi:hypothetical protein